MKMKLSRRGIKALINIIDIHFLGDIIVRMNSTEQNTAAWMPRSYTGWRSSASCRDKTQHTAAWMPRLARRQGCRDKAQGHSTAQHSTAQHSTAQHSTAQHSTANFMLV